MLQYISPIHGTYSATPRAVEAATRYFDGSKFAHILAHVQAASPDVDWSDLSTRTECIIILASFYPEYTQD